VHKSQHKFFQDFAEAPIPFIEDYIQSQIKDGEVRSAILLAYRTAGQFNISQFGYCYKVVHRANKREIVFVSEYGGRLWCSHFG
jgi:hypothetical protein